MAEIKGPVKNVSVPTTDARHMFVGGPSQPDPNWIVYFNDFLMGQDYAAADWTITTTEAGGGSASEVLATDEIGGALLLTNAADEADLDSLQNVQETYSLQNGREVIYETRVKINDVDQVNNFYGLSITDTTPLDASDKVGFRIIDGSASIECETTLNSATTQTDSQKDMTDDAYVRLGFRFDGSTKIYFYVDRVLVATHTTNLPTDEQLSITMHHQNGEAVAQTTTIDYIYLAQERS